VKNDSERCVQQRRNGAQISRLSSRSLLLFPRFFNFCVVPSGNTKAIQFEAFHVFKIFVANPKKSPGIVDILARNKRKLIEFLQKFQKDKENADEQFNEEKQTLLNTLAQLPDLPEPAAAAAGGAAHADGHDAQPAAAAAAAGPSASAAAASP
jgi:calcium binding protein 39